MNTKRIMPLLLIMASMQAMDATAQQNTTKEEQINGIVESTSATVRCDAGNVVTGGYEASSSDIIVDSQEPVDCENGCKAWQVTAHRETQDPFNLRVWVECSGG